MRKISHCVMIFALSAFSYAQESDTELPGNPSLPSSEKELQELASLDREKYAYSVESYFQRPKQSSFQFSPNGQYLSYREKEDDGKSHVYIKDTETGEVNMVVKEGEDLIRGYGWVNDTRIGYVQDKGGDENYHLFAVDIDGGNKLELTPYEGVKADIIEFLPDQENHIIVQMNKDNPMIFEPYKLDVRDGSIEKLYENKDPENPISSYVFDKDGRLRGYSQQQNGTEYVFFYRLDDKAPFKEILRTTWKENFSVQGFDYTTKYEHDAFVNTDIESDKAVIAKYDMAEGKITEVLFSDDTYDAGGLRRSRKRGYEVDFYTYTGERYQMIPVSDQGKKLKKRLDNEFAGYDVYISSVTDEEDKMLLYVTSDKLYGKYYKFDVKANEFTELLDLMPDLNERDMAEMRPIQFKTRDGMMMHGYITIPQGADKENPVPLIVNPHGGPYGPRDTWGFNPETQLFASRGYATIQINYRGSGGYGRDFMMAGNKQIGRNMLNDLEDGVEYAKNLGYIDNDRIAIYGASYGGLATLGSLVKTPDLYACGVDYVGVSNLFTFFKSFPPYWKPYLAQVYEQWYDENDPADQRIMKEVSPALNVDKMTKPLFVVQGANDPRVNIDESDQVVRNLRERGFDVPYMVKYDEGHGFGKEENRIELYKSMMGFFAKHLKG